MLTLFGLFAAAFLSATLVPGSSEAALAAALASGQAELVPALIVATLGNTLGSCVNWALGLYVAHWRGHRFFPVKEKDFARYEALYQKYGLWSLLASWVPIIGDPLTVIAGVMREPLWRFLLLVSLAKTGRYLVLSAFLMPWL